MDVGNFLSRQLTMLRDKYRGGDTEWSDVAELRERYYGVPENIDTTRKGGKLIGEYLQAGWDLIPPGGNDTMDEGPSQTPRVVTFDANGGQTAETQICVEDESKLCDSEYLLRLHGYDPAHWELVSSRNSRWNGVADGRILYSSKISVKPKAYAPTHGDLEQWLRELPRECVAELPVNIAIKPNHHYAEGGKMLLLNIADLHYNLMSTVLTTGEHYDCAEAEKLFWDVLHDVCFRTSTQKLAKIIFILGGDGLNADNFAGTTTRGTPQDNCLPMCDAYKRYCTLMVRAVTALEAVAPIDVIYVPGNHDKTLGFTAAEFLSAWFRDDPYVNVDASPLPRKYAVFGKTLFAFAHEGDKKVLPRIIADEARRFWSSTSFCEVMVQHFHHESVLDEEHHMRISQMPTVSANSAWSVSQGYGATRQAKSYIFDEKIGLTDVIYTVIEKGGDINDQK